MTEAEWRSTTDLHSLQDHYVRDGAEPISARKARLYGIACLRAAEGVGWPGDDRERTALDLVEKYVEGQATNRDLLDTCEELEPVILARRHGNPWDVLRVLLDVRLDKLMLKIMVNNAGEFWGQRSFPLDLIRDILGNPFRPVAFDPAWRTIAAVAIAKHIDESRDFSPMPILADALQDAGCDSDDVLDYCHRPGPHVRGCWVVDLVLGKV